MAGARVAIVVLLAATAAAASGCGLPFAVRTAPPTLEEFLDRVDPICLRGHVAADDAELAAEEAAAQARWPSNRVEAEIRFGRAAALRAAYLAARALGEPPARRRAYGRWLTAMGQRARVYRRWGEAWLRGDEERMSHLSVRVDIALHRTDVLAERLPFDVCGSGDPAFNNSPYEPGKHPPREYTGVFPRKDREKVSSARGLWLGHRRIGRVYDVVNQPGSTVAFLRYKRKYAPLALDGSVELFRSREKPGLYWLALQPPKTRTPEWDAAEAAGYLPQD